MRNRRGIVYSAIAAAMAVAALAGCSSSSGATNDTSSVVKVDASNTDPQTGPVFVLRIGVNGTKISTVKYCDNTTLVYVFVGSSKGGGDTIQNSPECGAPAPAARTHHVIPAVSGSRSPFDLLVKAGFLLYSHFLYIHFNLLDKRCIGCDHGALFCPKLNASRVEIVRTRY